MYICKIDMIVRADVYPCVYAYMNTSMYMHVYMRRYMYVHVYLYMCMCM